MQNGIDSQSYKLNLQLQVKVISRTTTETQNFNAAWDTQLVKFYHKCVWHVDRTLK